MQAQGVETDGLSFTDGISSCCEALDAATMAAEVQHLVTAITTAEANSILLDFDLASAGAGGKFLATIQTNNGDNETAADIRLSHLVFHWFEALDAAALTSKMNAYRATLGDTDALWAWDVVGGVGKWIAVFITWTPAGG